MSYTSTIPCAVTQSLIERLIASDAKGVADYGNTVDRRDFTPEQWAEHLIGELLDAAKYTLALLREVQAIRDSRSTRTHSHTDGSPCLLCGHIPEPQKSKRPTCYVCDQPFTRTKPWRLLRGKRVHVACIQTS